MLGANELPIACMIIIVVALSKFSGCIVAIVLGMIAIRKINIAQSEDILYRGKLLAVLGILSGSISFFLTR